MFIELSSSITAFFHCSACKILIASLYVFGIKYFIFSTKTFASCVLMHLYFIIEWIQVCLNTLEGVSWAWLLLLNKKLLLFTASAVLILFKFILDTSLSILRLPTSLFFKRICFYICWIMDNSTSTIRFIYWIACCIFYFQTLEEPIYFCSILLLLSLLTLLLFIWSKQDYVSILAGLVNFFFVIS